MIKSKKLLSVVAFLVIAVSSLILVVGLDSADIENIDLPPVDLVRIKQKNIVLNQPFARQKQTVTQVDLSAVADTSQQGFTFYPELTKIELLEDDDLLNSEFISRIETLSATGDTTIRLAAIESISTINHSISITALVGALGDPEPMIRIAALEVLALQPDRNVSMFLEPMLFDQDTTVRIVAIDALGDLENVQAVPALASLLSDHDPLVRYRAAIALDEIGGELASHYISQLSELDILTSN